MKRLIEQRYVIRQNILTIVGVCLCLYFTYHVAFGTRSYFGLLALEQSTQKLEAEYNVLHRERIELQAKVERLRPGSLDRDLLEERARLVLGYGYPDEQIILQTN